ncbi:mobilization protein [Streptomyces albidoflavus]
MMPKKARGGTDTGGLLAYLFGPGKRDEHVDPHVVAGWDGVVMDAGQAGGLSVADLALLMDAPVRARAGRPLKEHVWHVPVRNPPEDRLLSDAEWARVAREMVEAAGIAPAGDLEGCRWVAVRHADDHIHIVATLVRQDLRLPRIKGDILKMHQVARRLEAEWGLRPLVSGDGTAKKWPKTGELEKGQRRGLGESARAVLHRTVRAAAAAASSDEDFFARLAAAGVRVRQRVAPDGAVTGYSVALVGDRDQERRAVYFSGARLAADLSLPRVRERWQGRGPGTAQGWAEAEQLVRAASGRLDAGGLEEGAGAVAALGDLIVTAAEIAPDVVRDQMRAAAEEFERAGRAPGRRAEGEARQAYRDAAWGLVRVAGRGDAAVMLGLVALLVMAVAEAERWHTAQEHREQARSARKAGRLLREAVEVSAGATARARPVRSIAAARGTAEAPGAEMDELVRRAGVGQVVGELAWPALQERLREVEALGAGPGRVLEQVIGERELSSADSMSQVLVWRLDGWVRGRPAQVVAPRRGPGEARAGARTQGVVDGRSARRAR